MLSKATTRGHGTVGVEGVIIEFVNNKHGGNYNSIKIQGIGIGVLRYDEINWLDT